MSSRTPIFPIAVMPAVEIVQRAHYSKFVGIEFDLVGLTEVKPIILLLPITACSSIEDYLFVLKIGRTRVAFIRDLRFVSMLEMYTAQYRPKIAVFTQGLRKVRPRFYFHYTTTPPTRYNTPIKNKVSSVGYINTNLYLPKIEASEISFIANAGRRRANSGQNRRLDMPVTPLFPPCTIINQDI